LELFKNDLLEKHGTISPEDLDIFHLVDSVDEAMKYITKEIKNIKNVQQI
jgi:predicted Rossmann-fold nucleotide-binding protein